MILAFLAWEIYDIYPLIDPNHDGVVVPIGNLFNYLFFNLIVQYISFCEKSWNRENNKNKCMEFPSPLKNVAHQLSKIGVIHVEKKGRRI